MVHVLLFRGIGGDYIVGLKVLDCPFRNYLHHGDFFLGKFAKVVSGRKREE